MPAIAFTPDLDLLKIYSAKHARILSPSIIFPFSSQQIILSPSPSKEIPKSADFFLTSFIKL